MRFYHTAGLIFLFCISSMQAQTDFLQEDSAAARVLSYIHDFKFQKAQNILETKQKEFSPGLYNFLKVNFFWWVYVTSNDKSNYRDSLRFYIHKGEKWFESHDQKDSFLALMTNGFKYRLAFKEDRFLDGIWAAHQMSAQIKKSLDSAEVSPYYKLTAAIYLYSTGYGKEKYWWLYPYFKLIPAGDKQKGKNYLLQLSKDSRQILATEAAYTLLRIYMDIEQNYTAALPLAGQIVRMHPSNLFYKALELKIKEKLGLLTAEDVRAYNRMYKQVVFLNPEAEHFFKQWRNIH